MEGWVHLMEEIVKCLREASRWIDRTAGVVGPDGILVACTDERLEGDEDPSVRLAMASPERVIVTTDRTYIRAQALDGSPLFTFIQGTDPVSRNYLELLVRWIESALRERNTDAERDTFLKNVLLENELPGDIHLKAREYSIPTSAPRMVFLVHLDQSEDTSVMPILQGLFPDRSQDYVLAMDENTLVLLTEFDRDNRDFVAETAGLILDNLNSESMSRVHIAVGLPADSLKDTANSYKEAFMALTVGSIFYSDTYVVRYDQLGLGRLIYQLPPTLCHMFLDEVFPKGAYEALDSETLLTIAKFFENNLNGSETSRQLFVHRNTLVYRLDKVQKITGLDLRKFDDAVLFKLASMVRKYLEKQENTPFKTPGGKWTRHPH